MMIAGLTKPRVAIISPAMANANNGNWQTASRWAQLLQPDFDVSLLPRWQGERCDALIALHARRSAASVAAFTAACPGLPCIVVLTGTDLYRDIHHDDDARRSLRLATRLVLLQDAGMDELDDAQRGKACIIRQSTSASTAAQPQPQQAQQAQLDVTMIGHLREEKDPLTFMRAAALVTAPQVGMLHIGEALDAALGEQAAATQVAVSRYRWLGGLPHVRTLQILQRSHAMALTSKMEGGANVIIEAITSGVPVLASDISGNRGMLGADYAGYFPAGDSVALARLIDRSAEDTAFHALLQSQCAARAPLFSPERERAALQQLLDNCLSLQR
jgi:putative glycosyltransferase (TIGR04348 family)